jgi:hypothetical protein
MNLLKALLRHAVFGASFRRQIALCAGFTFVTVGATAQTAPTTFPADAVPITREAYEQHVAGRSFSGPIAAGGYWRYDFSRDGRFAWYLTNGTGGGRIDTGKVRLIEGNRFCGDLDAPTASPSTCNDVRLKDDLLLYKRVSNGEVVTLTAIDFQTVRPYEGAWHGKGFANWDSELVITSWGGSFRYYTNNTARSNDHCLGRDLPVTVVGASSDMLIVLVRAAEGLLGCPNFAIAMHRVDDATMKSRDTTFSR